MLSEAQVRQLLKEAIIAYTMEPDARRYPKLVKIAVLCQVLEESISLPVNGADGSQAASPEVKKVD